MSKFSSVIEFFEFFRFHFEFIWIIMSLGDFIWVLWVSRGFLSLYPWLCMAFAFANNGFFSKFFWVLWLIVRNFKMTSYRTAYIAPIPESLYLPLITTVTRLDFSYLIHLGILSPRVFDYFNKIFDWILVQVPNFQSLIVKTSKCLPSYLESWAFSKTILSQVNLSPATHKLHYLIACGYCLLSVGILASSEYFGKAMSCTSTHKDVHPSIGIF